MGILIEPVAFEQAKVIPDRGLVIARGHRQVGQGGRDAHVGGSSVFAEGDGPVLVEIFLEESPSVERLSVDEALDRFGPMGGREELQTLGGLLEQHLDVDDNVLARERDRVSVG